MRHFYLFDINESYVDLDKTHPYSLFKLFYDLYKGNKNNYKSYNKVYGSIINPIKRDLLNNNLFNIYKTNLFYYKYMNRHYYNNYLDKEKTRVTINNSFIKIDSNNIKPSFFKILNRYSNLFVCDFDNNDYFYLESIA